MGIGVRMQSKLAIHCPIIANRYDVDFRGLLMLLKSLLLAGFFTISSPALAATEAGTQAEPAMAGIERRNVEKMLAKHFSPEDIAGLKDYLRGAMMGLQTPMASDLKEKVRNFLTQMRLEYGFQFAVLMAELKKKVFRVLPPDLAELAEEFTQAPKAELEE
jgi:hypothetical protein